VVLLWVSEWLKLVHGYAFIIKYALVELLEFL
jgi:hypothetical protein